MDRQVQFFKNEAVIPSDSATSKMTRTNVEEEAQTIDPGLIPVIHEGLKIVASLDKDLATQKNNLGFSKVDTVIGHSLAESPTLTARQAVIGRRLVRKYRRQIPDEIVETIAA